MTVRAGRGWAEEASPEHQDQIPRVYYFSPFLRNFRVRCEAKSPETASRPATDNAHPEHVHPQNPASCLPAHARGGVPADFEMQSPPRLMPSIVRPNIPRLLLLLFPSGFGIRSVSASFGHPLLLPVLEACLPSIQTRINRLLFLPPYKALDLGRRFS